MTSLEEKRIEADKCISVAKQAMSDGDLKKAEKFLLKSQNFLPSEKAATLLQKVQEELSGSKSGPQSDKNSTFGSFESFKANGSSPKQPSDMKTDTNASASSGSSIPKQSSFDTSGFTSSFKAPQQQSANSAASANTSTSESKLPRRNSNSSSSGNNNSADKPYTAEQQESAKKVKKLTDLYAILSINKTATDVEIKAGYRKMALKFHPDKNKAPESEEAFKKVTEAYSILSDAQEREYYDKQGSTREDYRRAAARQYANEAAAQREAPLTPEDIFNMFFEVHGGGGRRQFRAHRAHHFAADQGQGGQQQQAGWMQLAHFLPILLLFLFSFMNSTGSEESPFALDPTSQFSIRRVTPAGTTYYVNNNFARRYGRDYRAIAQVEQMADQQLWKKLEEECNQEKKHQKAKMSEARKNRGPDQASLLQQASAMNLASCQKLDAIRAR
jgi:DnaJ family protein B protein 12